MTINPTSLGAAVDAAWRQELSVDPDANPLVLKAKYSGMDPAAIHAAINALDTETIPLVVRVEDIEQYCLTHQHAGRTIKANIRRLARGSDANPGFDEANDWLDAMQAFAQDGISGEDTAATAAISQVLGILSDPAQGNCMTPAQSGEIAARLSKVGSTVDKIGSNPTSHQVSKILGLI